MVAKELGVSAEIVRRLVYCEELEGVRIGTILRISRESIEEYLKSRRVTAR
jgi:excisionase family DNA binding protein